MNTSFKTISPIDGSVCAERNFALEEEIDSALDMAQEAFIQWREVPIHHRIDAANKILEYFIKNSADISRELTVQMGRPIRYSPKEITGGFKERVEYMSKVAESALGDLLIQEDQQWRKLIKKVPLGTVFVLAPWNYPYLTSVNAVIPALIAGNTVLLKHAQQTPLCAERYSNAAEYANLPKGVFQHLHLSHRQSNKILQDKRINYVSFTGSVSGGQAIARSASHQFIDTTLELGGKDPAYVRQDSSIDLAVEGLVDGSFFNSGQSCCGVERIYAHESIYEDFVDKFISMTKSYKLGNPLEPETTLGPVVRKEAKSYILNQVEDALLKGATACIDDKHFGEISHQDTYVSPQVFINVDHGMDIMREETFGPVVGIMKVKNDDEAVQLMNDSRYGLTASIWSTDIERSFELARDIHTGTCFLNRCDYLDPALAWTGVKDSGKGCSLSSLGYDKLTRPKSFHFKKY